MIELVLAADRNLVRQAGITALSAARTSSTPIHVTFLTPQADAEFGQWPAVLAALREENVACTLLPVAMDLANLQVAQHLTSVTYFRLLTPALMPSTTARVIYLDCDILVGRDLTPLWLESLQGAPLGAVPDPNFTAWDRLGLDPGAGYFNAGVLLLDLERIRREQLFESALAFSQAHPERLTWSDQCSLNATFTGRWHRLEPHWNYQYFMLVADVRARGMAAAVRTAAASLMHFNNYDRPWLPESAHPLRRRYFDIANRHAALDPSVPASLAARWVRLKRAAKWRLTAAGVA